MNQLKDDKNQEIIGNKKAIAVDFSQEGATSQVLARPNSLSSHQAEWEGIYLECHQHPAHETPEHYPQQHVIAIHTQGKVKAKRRLNERWQQEQINVGDVCIVPAHTRHWIHTTSKQELIFLSLDVNFFKGVAYESVQSDRLKLVPHFTQSDPLLYQLGLSLKATLQNDLSGGRFYAESLITAATAHLIQFYTEQKPTLDINFSNSSRIKQAIEYINAHLNEDLSLEAISSLLGISKYYFCRSFKQETGLTPWQYIIQLRVTAAKRLLVMPNLSITQISLQLGYSTPGQFANFFRQHTGISPSNYRRKL